MKTFSLSLVSACALFFFVPHASAQVLNTYDFSSLVSPTDSFYTYTSPATTVTSSTIPAGATPTVATFSSPYDSYNQIPNNAGDTGPTGEFVFGPNGGLFSNLGAYVLSSAGYASLPGAYPAVLDITFSKPQSAVTFDFATSDFFGSDGGDTLTLTTNTGGSYTTTATVPGTDFYPEGSVSFSSSTPFTSIEISTDDNLGPQDLVLADLTSTAAVPEPSTWTLLLSGLGMLAFWRLRSGKRMC